MIHRISIAHLLRLHNAVVPGAVTQQSTRPRRGLSRPALLRRYSSPR
jgi:hypothetical protein